MDYFLFSVGLALLLAGADRLVLGASALARRLGVSSLTISVFVVGFGTSMPELLTSLDAAVRGSSALAVANVVGSNIANVLLVLGLSAMCMPLGCDPVPMRRDALWLMLASMLALCALQQGTIERWMGFGLAIALLVYLSLLMKSARRPQQTTPETSPCVASAPGVSRSALSAVVSLATLLVGAHLLVSGALGIADRHGLPETLVGLTLVAIGTSLPELAVALLALVRRNVEVAIGNVVGSSLFNILGILGITAIVSPLAVPAAVARFDVWVMLAAALALALFVRTGWRINRVEGAALLFGYPAYLYALMH